MMHKFAWWLLCWCLALPAMAAEQPCVTVFTYHLAPPFLIDGIHFEGLSYRLLDQLNQRRVGGRCYRLEPLARPELNKRLQAGEEGLVLWGNLLWFRRVRPDMEASAVIYWDSDIVVSRPQALIDYQGPDSLRGKRVGTPAGHFYSGIDELAKQGALTRIDATSDLANLKALLAKQVDAILIARSVFDHLAPQIDITAFYLPTKPHDGYSRNILYTPSLKALAEPLNALIAALPEDETWSAEVRLLHLEDVVSVLDLDLDELRNVRLPPPQLH